jgi:hypothetical protein
MEPAPSFAPRWTDRRANPPGCVASWRRPASRRSRPAPGRHRACPTVRVWPGAGRCGRRGASSSCPSSHEGPSRGARQPLLAPRHGRGLVVPPGSSLGQTIVLASQGVWKRIPDNQSEVFAPGIVQFLSTGCLARLVPTRSRRRSVSCLVTHCLTPIGRRLRSGHPCRDAASRCPGVGRRRLSRAASRANRGHLSSATKREGRQD